MFRSTNTQLLNEHFRSPAFELIKFEIVYRNKLFTEQQSDIFELEILCIFLVSVCAAIPGRRPVSMVSHEYLLHSRNEKEKSYGELIFGSSMMVWYVMANRTYRMHVRALILYVLHQWWMVYIVPLLVRSFVCTFIDIGGI